MGGLEERDRRLPAGGSGDGVVSTGLKFRNLTASPDDPVEAWPFEGIVAAVERGTIPDRRRLADAIRADPWGPVAQQVLEAIRLSHPFGTAELMEGAGVASRTAGDRSATRPARFSSGGWRIAADLYPLRCSRQPGLPQFQATRPCCTPTP